MKKYSQLLVAIFSVVLGGVVFAQTVAAVADPLSPEEYEVGEEVTVTGQGFGELAEDKFICFNDENSCFLYDSEGITYWSDSVVRFIMPQWAKVSGQVTLYEGNNVVGLVNYMIKPTVYSYSHL